MHTVTTAPVSAAVDQDVRMKRYLVTMGIRTACFVGAWLVEGPMRWVFVAMAVVLPYVAVVLANAVGPRWGSRITGLDRFADAPAALPASPTGVAATLDGGPPRP